MCTALTVWGVGEATALPAWGAGRGPQPLPLLSVTGGQLTFPHPQGDWNSVSKSGHDGIPGEGEDIPGDSGEGFGQQQQQQSHHLAGPAPSAQSTAPPSAGTAGIEGHAPGDKTPLSLCQKVHHQPQALRVTPEKKGR